MGKRQRIREQRRREQLARRLLWIGLAVVTLAAILALALPPILASNTRIDIADLAQPPDKSYPQADINRLGDPNAPVTVVEFGDYLCSHCQDYALKDEEPIIERYIATGQVQYEYLPIALSNPSQIEPIEATFCAGDQGAFWPYRDLVYANVVKNVSAVNSNYLVAYAESLGLDTAEFNDCLRSGKHRPSVQEALDRAREAKIPGTPTFLVNGVEANRLNLSQVIDNELAKVSSN